MNSHPESSLFGSLPASKRFEVIILTISGSMALALFMSVFPFVRNWNEYLLLWMAISILSFPVVVECVYKEYPDERLQKYMCDRKILSTRKTRPPIKQRLLEE